MNRPASCRPRRGAGQRGAALIDIIFAAALIGVMATIAVPVVGGTLDRERTIIGTRYLAAQLQRARLEALKRARCVAVRIDLIGERAELRLYTDGNGNGVLQKDIDRGVDLPLTPASWLDEQSGNVSLRVNQLITSVGGDAALAPGDDPLHIGNTALLTFSPAGGATGGTLYVARRQGPQMAIRVFGATGRVRVLMFDAQTQQWHP
jgi:type II secretory pathway pseudopilin PulG